MKSAVEIERALRRLKPDLERKFHVARIGYFNTLTQDSENPEHDIDLLVHFKKPVGWQFFELEEFLEMKLERRVDITTENGIHPVMRDAILKQVHYL
ncbi:MAG: nucleotidyltransferase domain-containing protein [Flavobacteriales bacterium]|nr:nucleotidyltransferase domain-containing protein [Flavobacteriales bacterium]